MRTEDDVNVVVKEVRCLEYKKNEDEDGEILAGSLEQVDVTFQMTTAESTFVSSGPVLRRDGVRAAD